MSITIKDIANIAGISYSTVSRSLNDSPLVASKTKELVKKIAEEQGFEFNANARSLVTNLTGTIGIIYPDDFDEFSTHLYYSSLHNQLRKSLEKEDLDLIVSFAENRITKKNNIKKLISRKKIDGLIIAYSILDNETLKYIEDSNIPYVFFHEPVNKNDVDAIFCDHFYGGYIATQHLVSTGCKKIICLTKSSEEYKLRTNGYKSALQDKGIAVQDRLIFSGEMTFKWVQHIINENTELLKEVDGIFAQTDIAAWGVIESLKKLGIKVPEDIAIVGYDDVELSEYITPKLTTIHQPRDEVATLTCNRLYEMLYTKNANRKKKKKIILKPTLIVRESCGAKLK